MKTEKTKLLKSNPHKLFIQWFIIFAASIAGGLIAYNRGLIELFIKNDQSYICLILMILYVLGSSVAGYLAYRLKSLKKELVTKRLALLDLFSDNFFVLGLLGTIIGFCIMMYNSLGGQAPNPEQVIISLRAGLATAFYTTLVGIVTSIFLQLQKFVITHHE